MFFFLQKKNKKIGSWVTQQLRHRFDENSDELCQMISAWVTSSNNYPKNVTLRKASSSISASFELLLDNLLEIATQVSISTCRTPEIPLTEKLPMM